MRQAMCDVTRRLCERARRLSRPCCTTQHCSSRTLSLLCTPTTRYYTTRRTSCFCCATLCKAGLQQMLRQICLSIRPPICLSATCVRCVRKQ